MPFRQIRVFVVADGLGQIVVQVAIANMTKCHRANARNDIRYNLIRFLEELGHPGYGDGYIVLD